MPALDHCHAQFIRALEKDGWAIEPMPYSIPLGKRRNPLLVDIEARRDNRQIVIIEVKCFEKNTHDELYTAIGQYLIYKTLLNQHSNSHSIYLAIPLHAYHGIFEDIDLSFIEELAIKLVVFDLKKEIITQWFN